jgi:hypothetical protein
MGVYTSLILISPSSDRHNAMSRAPTELHDLELVAEWFATNGLHAQRFADAELSTGKTPDFRVFRDGQLVAYCEVKSPRDEWLDNQLRDAAPFQIVGGLRDDPTFNRIAGLVRKAVKQLDAVNPDRRLPNIVVIVNWADASHFSDLDEAMTGYLRLSDGTKAPTMLKISEGRMRDEKRRIDAYVWFDGHRRKVEGIFFTQSDMAHRDAVCSWFRVDQAKIRV